MMTSAESTHINGAFARCFLTAVSMILPGCEQFFIKTVKEVLRNNELRHLRPAIGKFIKQELAHSQIHTKLNYHQVADWPRNHTQAVIDWQWQAANKLLTTKQKLALTVCIEHITVAYAAVLLTNLHLLDSLDQEAQQVWKKHAIEELDHKAVTQDIWDALGYSRLLCYLTMTIALPVYMICVAIPCLLFLWHDRTLFKFATWQEANQFLFARNSGLITASCRAWLCFFKKNFHPNDIDHHDLLDKYL